MKLSPKQAARFSHTPQPSRLEGVRPDTTWTRPGAKHTRSELTNRELVRAAQAVQFRKGRKWSPEDEGTMDALDARTWGFGEVQRLRMWSLPSWVTNELVPDRRTAGYCRFLGILLSAYRTGTAGVTLSYEEAMSVCGVGSRATWRRWCQEWEELGLVRIIQCWREDTSEGPLQRCHGRLSYRLGPAWEQFAGPGLVEGAAVEGGKVTASWAQRVARGARKKARDRRKARKAELWQATRPGQGDPATLAPTTNSVPMAEGPAPKGVPHVEQLDAKEPCVGAHDVPQRDRPAVGSDVATLATPKERGPSEDGHVTQAVAPPDASELARNRLHGSPHPEPVEGGKVEQAVRPTSRGLQEAGNAPANAGTQCDANERGPATTPVDAPAGEQGARMVLGPTSKTEHEHGPSIVARPPREGSPSFFCAKNAMPCARTAHSEPSPGSTLCELHPTLRPFGDLGRPTAEVVEGSASLAAARPPAGVPPETPVPGNAPPAASDVAQAPDGGARGDPRGPREPERFRDWLRDRLRTTRNARFLRVLDGDAD